jgi:hypothetical protein
LVLSLPAATSRKKPLPVDLGVDENAGQIVGRVLAPLGDQPPAALEHLRNLLLPDRFRALRVHVGIAGAQHRVHDPRPVLVVLGRDAHEAPDHPRDDRLRDVGHQVAGLAAVKALQHADGDLADRVLVVGDPLRREAALEERLEAVVLGRVHADEHRLDQLQRQDRVGERGDAADLGGVGLPVAADRVDVVGSGRRPVAVLLGVLGDPRRPVDRALGAHPLEQVIGRPVQPLLALGDKDLLDRRLVERGLWGGLICGRRFHPDCKPQPTPGLAD